MCAGQSLSKPYALPRVCCAHSQSTLRGHAAGRTGCPHSTHSITGNVARATWPAAANSPTVSPASQAVACLPPARTGNRRSAKTPGDRLLARMRIRERVRWHRGRPGNNASIFCRFAGRCTVSGGEVRGHRCEQPVRGPEHVLLDVPVLSYQRVCAIATGMLDETHARQEPSKAVLEACERQ